MKFQILSFILFFALSGVQALQYDSNINGPVCARFREIMMNGNPVTADTVAGFFAPGDMSIATDYYGSIFYDYPFFNVQVNMDSICVATNDPSAPAPTCFYEVEMSFCRGYWFIQQTYEEFKPVKVKRSAVITEIEYDRTVEGLFGNRRKLQTNSLRGNSIQYDGTKPLIIDDYDLAIQVTDNMIGFDENSKKLFDVLCYRRKLCYIPWRRWDCRKGGWTAHGSGPDPIEVTGGTDDFFGAFGQFETPTNFDPVTASFGMKLEMCYYRKEDPNFF